MATADPTNSDLPQPAAPPAEAASGQDVLALGFADFEARARALLPSGWGLAGAIYSEVFSRGVLAPEGRGLSEASTRAWRGAFRVGLLEVKRTVEEEGEFGPTIKALLACGDGSEIEVVLIPMPSRANKEGSRRATLCLSSQVGCRMGCAFCETGRGGLSRNLGAAEIVSQLVTVRALLGWDFGNLVFMGMGEPLDNLEEVATALRIITDPRGLGFGWERITVCTSGDSRGIARLRELGHPRLNLSLSLNAADDETRSALMPANRRSNLASLAAALAAYPRRRNFAFALNWCLIPGRNDSREDARGAAAFARSLGRALVNLIPYNPGSAPLARAPTAEELDRFAAWLEAEGCLVKRRATKGGAIMAGCGQLGGRAVDPARP